MDWKVEKNLKKLKKPTRISCPEIRIKSRMLAIKNYPGTEMDFLKKHAYFVQLLFFLVET